MKVKDRVPKDEIERQLIGLKERLKAAKANDKKGKEFLRNINAYVHDCEHFLKVGNYVLAFESIVWAWAWYEIGKELKSID